MKVVIVSCLVLFQSILWGQNVEESVKIRSNEIGLKVGHQYSEVYDAHFSIFPYQGHGFGVGVQYVHQKESTKPYLSFDFNGSFSTINTNVPTNFESELYVIRGSMNYGIPIYKRGSFQLYTGARLFANLNIPLFQLNGAIALSFLSQYSLDFQTKFDYKLTKRLGVSGIINVPLLNLIGRPPYGTFNEDFSNAPINYALSAVEFKGAKEFLALQAGVELIYEISSRWKLAGGFDYSTRVISNEDSAVYSFLNTTLTTSFRF